MRPFIAAPIAVLALMLGTSGLIQSAAARADPYTVSDCIESEVGHVYCYEETGVVVANDTPSSHFVGISHSRVTYTLTINGVLVESGQTMSRFVHIDSGSQAQVDRFNGRHEVAYTDPGSGETTECTYTFIFVYAGGAIRHEADALVCE
jgi:hypothetical protein